MYSLDKAIQKLHNHHIGPSSVSNFYEKRIVLKESGVLYVFFSPWGARPKICEPLKKRIAKHNYSFLGFFLHDEILSADSQLTKSRFCELIDIAVVDIKELFKSHKFKEVRLIGISLGGVPSLMLSKEISDLVSRMTLVVPGHCLAESMWNSIVCRNIVKKMEEDGITLGRLKQFWTELAPQNNIGNLKGKDVEVYLSRTDLLIPYYCGDNLVKAMNKNGINPKVHVDRFLGHYLTCLKYIYFPGIK